MLFQIERSNFSDEGKLIDVNETEGEHIHIQGEEFPGKKNNNNNSWKALR